MVDGGRYQEICDNLIVELQEKTESNERLLLPNSGVPCTRKNVLIKLWSTDYQQDSHKTITQQKKLKNCHDITVEEISPENRPKVPKEIAQTGWTMNGKIN